MTKCLRRSIKDVSTGKKVKSLASEMLEVVAGLISGSEPEQVEKNQVLTEPIDQDQELKVTIQPILEQIKKLAKQYRKKKLTSVPIISVAGCSGAGKTHFSGQLKKILADEGFNVFLLEQDNFLQYDQGFADPIEHINPFLKWTQVHEIMQQIKNGVSCISMPHLNRNNMPYIVEHTSVDLSAIEIVLFEGTYSLGDADTYNFFTYCNLGIFLDTCPANSSQWVKDREKTRLPHLQRTKDKLENDIHAELQRYHKFVVPSKKNASFILYKEKKDQYSVFVLHKNIKND